MVEALIGFSGFVGGTLLRQTSFDDLYRSTNIDEIRGRTYGTIVCAGAPAQKWLANAEPDADRKKIEDLIANLVEVRCEHFVLVSTVDVFQRPVGVDETTIVDTAGLQPYGLHRRMLEEFVEESFSNHLIIRLPGLVGPGLRKNVIFDLLNDNNLDAVDHRSVFQFYPTVNLWHDIGVALDSGLSHVHLTATPVSVAEIAEYGAGRTFENRLDPTPASYDMQSVHAELFGGPGRYQYSSRETFQAVRSYMQSEILNKATNAGFQT